MSIALFDQRHAPTVPVGICDPLCLTTPINPANVFGATNLLYYHSRFPVPVAPIEIFDIAVFRPHLIECQNILQKIDRGWRVSWSAEPRRYLFLLNGVPSSVPFELWHKLPKVPKLTLKQLMLVLAFSRHKADQVQIFELLSMFENNVAPDVWAQTTKEFPWVIDYLR